MKPVAIIGGGITGLTAAFRLQQHGVPVILYEGANRVGGVIQSIRQGGFLAECGPNTMLETSPKVPALVHDLGLEGRRKYSDPAAKSRFLVRDGRLVSLPNSVPAFLGTRLFSPWAKLRLLAEPFIAPAPADREESVDQFVLRRLGRDFLDYAINPLVGGIYAGDPAQLSVRQAFPKLHALEQKYHSLLMGQFLGARERKRRAEVSKKDARAFSFDAGLQTITDALRDRLGAAVRLGAPVRSIQAMHDGWQVTARVDGREETEDCSAVLFTGTAHKLAQLHILGDKVPDLDLLAEIYYPPVTSVVLGFRREDVAHPLNGFGVLIPEVEKFNILGTIFSTSLFPNRAPSGQVLLTSYLGGARNPNLALLDPGEQIKLVMHDLRKLLGVTGQPTFEQVFSFAKAIPQYEVGYGRYKQLMDNVEMNNPGFFMAGHYRDGISLSDSIVSGHEAAERIQAYLFFNHRGEETTDHHLSTAA